MWFIYIIKCRDGRLYTGMTSDLKRRFEQHKRGKGARFTRSFGAEKLVYSEGVRTRKKAMKREAEIKRWPRPRKLALIRGNKSL
ncbi:MAG: GIY-YIG nuclease family protein [bacterium]|nr:GIY-YIG nuclease family protein [bacterium]